MTSLNAILHQDSNQTIYYTNHEIHCRYFSDDSDDVILKLDCSKHSKINIKSYIDSHIYDKQIDTDNLSFRKIHSDHNVIIIYFVDPTVTWYTYLTFYIIYLKTMTIEYYCSQIFGIVGKHNFSKIQQYQDKFKLDFQEKFISTNSYFMRIVLTIMISWGNYYHCSVHHFLATSKINALDPSSYRHYQYDNALFIKTFGDFNAYIKFNENNEESIYVDFKDRYSYHLQKYDSSELPNERYFLKTYKNENSELKIKIIMINKITELDGTTYDKFQEIDQFVDLPINEQDFVMIYRSLDSWRASKRKISHKYVGTLASHYSHEIYYSRISFMNSVNEYIDKLKEMIDNIKTLRESAQNVNVDELKFEHIDKLKETTESVKKLDIASIIRSINDANIVYIDKLLIPQSKKIDLHDEVQYNKKNNCVIL